MQGTVWVWGTGTEKLIGVLTGHTREVNSVAFSPDGMCIVTASNDGTARVWEGLTGKQLAILEGHVGQVHSAAWSPDGVQIVTASQDKTVHLWRVSPSTNHLVQTAKEHLRRCLTPTQRAAYFLPEAPPLWCIERRLWPYHTEDWQAWLAARNAGRDTPLPVGPRQ